MEWYHVVDLDWPLNASSLLSASAELLVIAAITTWEKRHRHTIPFCLYLKFLLFLEIKISLLRICILHRTLLYSISPSLLNWVSFVVQCISDLQLRKIDRKLIGKQVREIYRQNAPDKTKTPPNHVRHPTLPPDVWRNHDHYCWIEYHAINIAIHHARVYRTFCGLKMALFASFIGFIGRMENSGKTL